MIKHVTFNFTVDRAGGMLSCIATIRKPTDNERIWADWHKTVLLEGAVYHVLGRGDVLLQSVCRLYALAHITQSTIWQHVDLSELDGK